MSTTDDFRTDRSGLPRRPVAVADQIPAEADAELRGPGLFEVDGEDGERRF